jgi:hypothetical protein
MVLIGCWTLSGTTRAAAIDAIIPWRKSPADRRTVRRGRPVQLAAASTTAGADRAVLGFVA